MNSIALPNVSPHRNNAFIRHLLIIALLAAILLAAFVSPHRVAAAAPDLNFRNAATGTKEIKFVAFAPDDGWVVLFGDNGYSTHNVPKELNDELSKLNDDGKVIKQVAFTSDGGWIVLFGNNGYSSKGLVKKLTDKLSSLNDDNKEIKQVAFTSTDNFLILVDQNGYSSLNVPTAITDKLDALNSDSKEIKQVVFMPSQSGTEGADDEWLIVNAKNAFAWSDGIGEGLITQLKKINKAGDEIQNVALAADGSWVVVSSVEVTWSKGVSTDLVAKIKELSKS